MISTAGDAALSVADPATANAGHLVNGAFFLPQKLQASATTLSGTAAAFAPLGGARDDAGQLRRAGQQRPGDAAVQAAGRRH